MAHKIPIAVRLSLEPKQWSGSTTGWHSAGVSLLPDVLSSGPVELRRWRPAFVDALVPVIALSFAELQQWMDWAHVMPTAEDLHSVLEAGEAAFDTDQEWN